MEEEANVARAHRAHQTTSLDPDSAKLRAGFIALAAQIRERDALRKQQQLQLQSQPYADSPVPGGHAPSEPAAADVDMQAPSAASPSRVSTGMVLST